MFGVLQILVSPRNRRLLAAGALVLVAGCGQKGPLFVPTGEQAAGRATLPETAVTGPWRVLVESTRAAAEESRPGDNSGFRR